MHRQLPQIQAGFFGELPVCGLFSGFVGADESAGKRQRAFERVAAAADEGGVQHSPGYREDHQVGRQCDRGVVLGLVAVQELLLGL
ncbi:hypothetical protein D9M72_422340 [compost metagenome]